MVFFDIDQYPDRDKVLNESTYQSPNPLAAFCIISHVPLVHESHEDFVFYGVREQLREWLTIAARPPSRHDERAPIRRTRTVLGGGGRLNLSDQLHLFFEIPENQNTKTVRTSRLRRLLGTRTVTPVSKREVVGKNDAGKVRNAAGIIDTIVQDLTGHNREAMKNPNYRPLVDPRPEYFLFSCHSLIVQEVNRAFFDTRAGQPELVSIHHHCESLMGALGELLRLNAYSIREAIEALVEHVKSDPQRPSGPNLGRMIAGFRAKANANIVTRRGGIAPAAHEQTFDTDFIEMDLSGNVHQHAEAQRELDSHFKVRWNRSNQFWAYTFTESWICRPLLRVNATGRPVGPGHGPYETPYLNLFQQPADIKDKYSLNIGQFLAMLGLFMANVSVADRPFLYEMIQDLRTTAKRDFPGRLLSGSHYAFVPFGVLVLFLYFPKFVSDHIAQHSAAICAGTTEELKRLVKQAIEALDNVGAQTRGTPEYRDFVTMLKREFASDESILSLAGELEQTLSMPIPRQPGQEAVATLLNLGWQIWQRIHQSKKFALEIGRMGTRFCIDLWTAGGQRKENSPRPNPQDFVSCYVVDRMALYFTNFRPLGDLGFTRTLFIDFAMQGYQRGRLGQRLCDIATYRSISIRDINRVRAMIRGMDEISSDLNSWITPRSTHDGIRSVRATAEEQRVVDRLDAVQRQLDLLNSFVIYGVRGKHLSARDFLRQIVERTRDIRQERIAGYPMLGDFLERRVAHIVRDIARMDELHAHLRQRVRDAYERVRTRLNSIETSRMSRTSPHSVLILWIATMISVILGVDALLGVADKVIPERGEHHTIPALFATAPGRALAALGLMVLLVAIVIGPWCVSGVCRTIARMCRRWRRSRIN